jgi:hypothetical protein
VSHATPLPALNEWCQYGPDANPELAGLTLPEAGHREARALASGGIVEIHEDRQGLHVQTRSFVGRFSVGPLELTILPK